MGGAVVLGGLPSVVSATAVLGVVEVAAIPLGALAPGSAATGSGCRARAAAERNVGGRAEQRDHRDRDDRTQPSVGQVCLQCGEEVAHGFTFTVADAVAELVDEPLAGAGVAAPVGELLVAVPVSPCEAGSWRRSP